MNNFKRLEEEELDRLPDLPLGISQNVNSSLGNMRTLGSVVELYFAKIFDVFVMMAGGRIDTPPNNFSNPGGHGSPTEPDSGIPGGPSEG